MHTGPWAYAVSHNDLLYITVSHVRIIDIKYTNINVYGAHTMLFIEPKSKMTECAQNRGLDWNKKEFVENSKRELKKCNVLVGCTGSVASIKLLNIIEQLNALEYKVRSHTLCCKKVIGYRNDVVRLW